MEGFLFEDWQSLAFYMSSRLRKAMDVLYTERFIGDKLWRFHSLLGKEVVRTQ